MTTEYRVIVILVPYLDDWLLLLLWCSRSFRKKQHNTIKHAHTRIRQRDPVVGFVLEDLFLYIKIKVNQTKTCFCVGTVIFMKSHTHTHSFIVDVGILWEKKICCFQRKTLLTNEHLLAFLKPENKNRTIVWIFNFAKNQKDQNNPILKIWFF